MRSFADYASIQRYLDELGMFRMDFSLSTFGKSLDFFGLRRPLCPVVQVLGTNGKGSTSTFLASLATAHNLRTGLYTSPHFVTPRERIRLDGTMLSEAAWTRLAQRLQYGMKILFPASDKPLTYFEWLTLLALLAFAEAHTDLIILEAGLGGTLDATSQVSADVLCYTPIDLDHQHILGPDIASIAKDKAGAMHPNCTVITGPQHHEVLEILRAAAQSKGLSLLLTPPLGALPPLGLAGAFQHNNANLALTAWRHLSSCYNWPFSEEEEQLGLKKAFIAGRFQHIAATGSQPAYILDGAHNAHGLQALAATLAQYRQQPGAIVFTCLTDKDNPAQLQALQQLAGKCPVFVPPLEDNPRAESPLQLCNKLHSMGLDASPAESLQQALEMAARSARQCSPERPVLVTGSLYLLGAFFTLHPSCLIPMPE